MAKRTRRSNKRPSKRPTTIFQLWDRFVKAEAAMQAAPRTSPPGKISNPAFDRAVRRVSDIAKLIVVHPADCFEEMHLKIKAALWSADPGTPVDKLDDWTSSPEDGEEIGALLSLRGDLKQLQEQNEVAVAMLLKLYGIDPKGEHQPRA
jgi:hypothetical protein